jgi:hypothetical protein
MVVRTCGAGLVGSVWRILVGRVGVVVSAGLSLLVLTGLAGVPVPGRVLLLAAVAGLCPALAGGWLGRARERCSGGRQR